jgi:hypothetical protein
MSAARKPLSERIRDVVTDLVDGVVEAMAGILNPPPAPVPIPIRGRRPR